MLPPHRQEATKLVLAAVRCLVPLADTASLFNHAVGEQLQRVGHRETEGCGGLEIDDKLVSERELNRQIAWARARNILST